MLETKVNLKGKDKKVFQFLFLFDKKRNYDVKDTRKNIYFLIKRRDLAKFI